LDIPINFELLTHGWILMKGTKMSKSKGNTIYPTDVSRNYGLDALRYYLIKEMPFGNDGLFTWELFFERFNSDLANDLGNLVSRTISMINKYFGGKVTKPDKNYFEEDKALEDLIDTTNKVYFDTFDNFQFKNGLTAVFDLISKANKYIDLTEPWRLAKDLEKQNDLNDVLYHLYEVLRITSIMLDPVMDDTSKIIFNELGLMDTDIDFKLLKYGHTHQSQVIKEPIVLFQRIKIGEELEKIKKAK
ncbi:MAG: class I tRNA ligase family protein, partial [Bacilli bacterium]